MKTNEHLNWTQAAPGWKKHDARVRACFAPVTERMLQVARIGAGQRVLDIASGTGEPALSAAVQVGKSGYVLATDFVEEMLAFAREKAKKMELSNIEIRRVDGEELSVPDGSFDAVLIRWGIMFMPDPVACLKRAHAALRTGGRIAVACWDGPARSPAIGLPMAIIKRYVEVPPPPPGAPNIFAFADPNKLRSTLEAAGFSDVSVEEVHVMNGGEFEDGRAFFRFLLDLAAPIARLFGQLTPELQERVQDEVAEALEAFRSGSHIAVPSVTWIAHARR